MSFGSQFLVPEFFAQFNVKKKLMQIAIRFWQLTFHESTFNFDAFLLPCFHSFVIAAEQVVLHLYKYIFLKDIFVCGVWNRVFVSHFKKYLSVSLKSIHVSHFKKYLSVTLKSIHVSHCVF